MEEKRECRKSNEDPVTSPPPFLAGEASLAASGNPSEASPDASEIVPGEIRGSDVSISAMPGRAEERFPEVPQTVPDEVLGSELAGFVTEERSEETSPEAEATDPGEIPGLDLSMPGGEPSEVEATARKIRLRGMGKGRAKGTTCLLPPQSADKTTYSPEQRILILDTWERSGLPAKEFGPLVGLAYATLYKWKRMFDEYGPEGLNDQPRKKQLSMNRLPEFTRRAIVMIKERHPEYGVQRISDMLARGPALPASPAAVARVLHEAGYQAEGKPTQPHPEPVKHFERAKPNQLWQTDLFTFVLKRQNRRVHLVAFMDDHSRFIVGYGLAAGPSTELVLETMRSAIASFQAPEELLTDNGPQYVTWRGKSRLSKECEKLGIKQIVSKPRHPQTLGKIERFWGTLWREFLCVALFLDMEDARRRIGLFIDHYNFQRPHQGLDGVTPGDRYFGAASDVLAGMRARLQANALELAKLGVPKKPFYITGQLGGKPFSLHTEGDKIFLLEEGGRREEVNLVTPCGAAPEGLSGEEDFLDDVPGPDSAVLDEGLKRIGAAVAGECPESEE